MFRLFFAALLPSLLAIVAVPSLAISDGDVTVARAIEQEDERKKPDAVVSLVKGDVSPATITIRPGQTVRWLNKGNRDFSLATSEKDSKEFKEFKSGVIKPGRSWDYRFEKEGTFRYHCLLRPRAKGVVKVVADEEAAGAEARMRKPE